MTPKWPSHVRGQKYSCAQLNFVRFTPQPFKSRLFFQKSPLNDPNMPLKYSRSILPVCILHDELCCHSGAFVFRKVHRLIPHRPDIFKGKSARMHTAYTPGAPFLALLDYVSRAHEIVICPSSVVHPSVRFAIISEINARIRIYFKF